MKPEDNFKKIAPLYMAKFMKDFNCTEEDAAAVFGNAGYESLGFTALQEIKPTVAGSRGGYGWFQWTGPRRTEFEAYCKRNNYHPSDNDANYKWLYVELKTTEKNAIIKLKNAKTLNDKVVAFEEGYERAGVKAYERRQKWAQMALESYKARSPLPTPTEAPKQSVAPKKPSGLFDIILDFILSLFKKRK